MPSAITSQRIWEEQIRTTFFPPPKKIPVRYFEETQRGLFALLLRTIPEENVQVILVRLQKEREDDLRVERQAVQELIQGLERFREEGLITRFEEPQVRKAYILLYAYHPPERYTYEELEPIYDLALDVEEKYGLEDITVILLSEDAPPEPAQSPGHP